jgi:hypothetical protein
MMNRYLLAGLGLLVLTLAVFAVMSPFNGASNDEWSYLYLGRLGEWQGFRINRDFSAGGAVIADFLLPDRAQNIHVIHVASTYFISLGLFHLAYRLMRGYGWLAFTIAAVYLVYIPYNMEQSRALYIEPYSWAILMMVICAVLLVEYFFRAGRVAWIFLILSAGMAYVAARVYEGFIPFLAVLPVVYFWFTSPPPRGSGMRQIQLFWAGILLWWLVAGIGSLQFIIPYLRGDESASYQSNIQEVDNNPRRLIDNTADFLKVSFPLEDEILTTPFNYILPSLLLTGLFLAGAWLLWRSEPQAQRFPPLRFWLVMLGLGAFITLLGGLAFIYAGLHLEMRSQFIAAPGEAILLVGLLGGMAWLAGKLIRLQPPLAMAALLGVFLLTAGQWQLESQVWAATNRAPTFDAKTPFFRDLLAMMPELEPDTAIIYRCAEPQNPLQIARLSDLFAVEYLYDGRRVEFIALPYHFAPLRIPVVEFTETGVNYSHEYDLLGLEVVRFAYGYDQLVVVECAGDSIRITERFPAELAPAGAHLETYNPYARVKPDFIARDDARVLGR